MSSDVNCTPRLLENFTFETPLPYNCSDTTGSDCEKHVTFFDVGHKYVDSLHPDIELTSVTTLIHGYFPEFEAVKISETISRNPKSLYYGKTPVEIRDGWEKNRNEAATLGTNLHKAIESIYNGHPVCEPKRELELFRNFHNDLIDRVPYKTERIVCSREARITGSIDMIYKDSLGFHHVYDWKRSKEIKMEARDTGFFPLTEFQNTNYSHYCLQLNIYSYLLDTLYGYNVKSMTLVILHPEQDNYITIPVPPLREPVIQLIKHFIDHGFLLPRAFESRFGHKIIKNNLTDKTTMSSSGEVTDKKDDTIDKIKDKIITDGNKTDEKTRIEIKNSMKKDRFGTTLVLPTPKRRI